MRENQNNQNHSNNGESGHDELADSANLAELTKLATAVKDFYRILTPDSVGKLDSIYHPDILFTDPATQVCGLPALQQHFQRLLANTKQCDFEFFDDRQAISKNVIVLCWRMTLVAAPLAKGKPFTVDGTSVLVCQDARIREHRDYFDLGAMLYEQLPLIGKIIRNLRNRLAAH